MHRYVEQKKGRLLPAPFKEQSDCHAIDLLHSDFTGLETTKKRHLFYRNRVLKKW
jgi:hypothetical protein